MAGAHRPEIRTGIPALPFCKALLRAPKPLPPGFPRDPQTLGEHLRRRRLEQGLTQEALGTLLGVSEATVVNWEARSRTPCLRAMPAVARFLGGLPDDHEGSLTLGQRLRRHRRILGLTQTELAAQLQVDPGTLARWEAGRRRPRGRFMVRVEALLRAGPRGVGIGDPDV